MLTGLDFPGSRKNFPFPGKKFPNPENFGRLQNPYQACLCNSKQLPPTLTHATLPWTGGEAYRHDDCLWNDRKVAAVKIWQYGHWNNSALYSRSPAIRPPKLRETRPVWRFTVAVPRCSDADETRPACCRRQWGGGTNLVDQRTQ